MADGQHAEYYPLPLFVIYDVLFILVHDTNVMLTL